MIIVYYYLAQSFFFVHLHGDAVLLDELADGPVRPLKVLLQALDLAVDGHVAAATAEQDGRRDLFAAVGALPQLGVLHRLAGPELLLRGGGGRG